MRLNAREIAALKFGTGWGQGSTDSLNQDINRTLSHKRYRKTHPWVQGYAAGFNHHREASNGICKLMPDVCQEHQFACYLAELVEAAGWA